LINSLRIGIRRLGGDTKSCDTSKTTPMDSKEDTKTPKKTTHLPLDDDDIRELGDFLGRPNPELRKQTLDFLLKFSAKDEDIQALVPFGLERPILRLLSDPKSDRTIFELTLKLLVNLSAEASMLQALVKKGLIDAVMDWLIVADNRKMPKLALMVLNNVVLDVECAKLFMQEGKQFEGLHAVRLIKWFVESGKNLSSAEGFNNLDDDHWGLVAGILANLSQLESFRKLCVDPKRSVLVDIKSQLSSPSEVRRMGILRLIHNLAYDYDKHAYLLDLEVGLFTQLLLRLVHYDADGDIDEEEAEPMIPEIKSALRNPHQKRESSKDARKLILDTLLILVRNYPTRQLMKGWHVYHLLRELHVYERDIGHDEADELLSDSLIPYFILDENEEEMRRAMQGAAAKLNQQARDPTALQLEAEENKVTVGEEAQRRQMVRVAQAEEEPEGPKPSHAFVAVRDPSVYERAEQALDEGAKGRTPPKYDPFPEALNYL